MTDRAILYLSSYILSIGSVLCPVQYPVPVATRIVAKLMVMNTERAITRGYPVELYYQSVCEPATVSNLLTLVHKSSGEVSGLYKVTME